MCFYEPLHALLLRAAASSTRVEPHLTVWLIQRLGCGCQVLLSLGGSASALLGRDSDDSLYRPDRDSVF